MNALTKIESTALSAMTEVELIEVLQSSLYPGASLGSIKMVLGYCKAAGLDPMKKPVHIVPMWDAKSKSMRDVIMPGVGNYRTDAARTGEYAGITEPEFGPDTTETLSGTTITFPLWCRVTVRRRGAGGAVAEFTAREFWKENYATAGRDTAAPNAMWKKRPYAQLAKCAEAQALRKAFPEAGSQPTSDEMEGKSLGDEYAGTTVDAASGRVIDRQAAAEHLMYPEADFEKNLPSWRKAIESKKKTAEDVIATVETKGKLTDAQKARIRGDKAEAKDQPQDVTPKVTYAELADRLHQCEDRDAAALILDEGRALSEDQKRDRGAIFTTKFGE